MLRLTCVPRILRTVKDPLHCRVRHLHCGTPTLCYIYIVEPIPPPAPCFWMGPTKGEATGCNLCYQNNKQRVQAVELREGTEKPKMIARSTSESFDFIFSFFLQIIVLYIQGAPKIFHLIETLPLCSHQEPEFTLFSLVLTG